MLPYHSGDCKRWFITKGFSCEVNMILSSANSAIEMYRDTG